MSEKVAVIGCGPAGLIAAYEAERLEYDVDIFSIKQKSPIGGAQYLHAPLEGLKNHPESEMLYMFKMGSEQGYAEKVYGKTDAPVSFSNYRIGPQVGYSLQKVYDLLWDRYEDQVIDMPVKVLDLESLLSDASYRKVFNSAPRNEFCKAPDHHTFDAQGIVLVPVGMTSIKNTIVYSGRLEERWYRTSFLDGEGWTEYSMASIGEESVQACLESGGKIGYKPLKTDCDCHPTPNDKLVTIGRFGSWEKSALLHHVPSEIWKTIR